MIYGSVRRDLRDRERGWEVEDRGWRDRSGEDQIVSPRGKAQYIGGKIN